MASRIRNSSNRRLQRRLSGRTATGTARSVARARRLLLTG